MVDRVVKIAIVEDCEILARKVERIILKVLTSLKIQEDEYRLDLYFDGESALDSGVEYDISFLDVYLGGGIDGFRVGKEMKANYRIQPLLIVLTNFADRGEESFDIRAYWYLTKASIEEKLHYVTAGAIKEIIPIDGVFIKENDEEKFIYFKHIRVIQRVGSGVHIYTINSVVVTYEKSLNYWQELLPQDQYVFPHRSNIINLEYMEECSKHKKEIVMKYRQKSESVKVATRKLADIQKAHDNYLLMKARGRIC